MNLTNYKVIHGYRICDKKGHAEYKSIDESVS